MGKRKREIQVGVLTILAIIVFVVGLLWFKQFRFQGDVVRYAVDFPRVEALQKGDRVHVRGIRLGAVDGLELADDGVRVYFHVDEEADLRQDAQFELQTVGIVGEKIIDITPGTGPDVPPGYVFQGQTAPGIAQLGGSAATALEQVEGLAADIRAMVSELRAEGGLTETLAATRDAAANLSGMVNENRAEFELIVENLARTSAVLRDVLAGPDSTLVGTARGARSTLARVDTVMTNLQAVTTDLAGLVSGLQRGEGTAGRLLADQELYNRLESTLASVQELVDDIRRNPKRFFNLNLLDF